MKRETKFKQTEIGMIPEDWEEVIFSKVVAINPKRNLKKGESAKFVSMADIQPFTRKISNFIIKEFKSGSKFRNGDTLFARITPCLENGKTAFVDILNEGEVGFGSTEFIVLSAKENKTDPSFVYYLLRSPEVRSVAIKSMTGTSGRQRVENDVFDSIIMKIPPLPEQSAIAKILSDLDSKIELKHKMNKTLEEIGQAIFKHWFVDFEFPNEEGKPYKSSGGEMVYNEELGENIPKGWRIGKIKDLVNVLSGFAFSSSEFTQSGKYKLVTIKNVQDRYFNPETKDRLDALPPKVPSFCNLKTGDILLSLTGNVGRICLVVGKNYLLNQRVAKLEPVDSHDYAFSYFLFLQESIFSILQSIASGTAQQNLSPVQTKEIKIVIPPRKLLNDFGNLTNTMIQKINNNNSQIQTLSQIRDALLPKLMSGKIRVPLEEKSE